MGLVWEEEEEEEDKEDEEEKNNQTCWRERFHASPY